MSRDSEILQVSAGVLTLKNGRILLARRAPGRSQAGLWEFPGGKLETGEGPPACLVRELREELGLQVQVLDPVATVQGWLPSGRPLRLWAYRVRLLPPVPQWVASSALVDGGVPPPRSFPDHDRVAWPRPEDLLEYPMPQVDVDVARALQEAR